MSPYAPPAAAAGPIILNNVIPGGGGSPVINNNNNNASGGGSSSAIAAVDSGIVGSPVFSFFHKRCITNSTRIWTTYPEREGTVPGWKAQPRHHDKELAAKPRIRG